MEHSEEKQLLLILITKIFCFKIKNDFPNTSNETIEQAIKQVFLSYTKERCMEEEIRKRLKN